MSNISATLSQRGDRYGPFEGHASIAQELKRTVHRRMVPKLKKLVESDELAQSEADAMLEALDMVCHKIGRIANGDPLYLDSWHDIVGYVTLVEKIIENKDLPQ